VQPILVRDRTEPFIAQAGARLGDWALESIRREAIDTGDPAALRAWADSAGPIDEAELGVGD
jgi:hypothetical protein